MTRTSGQAGLERQFFSARRTANIVDFRPELFFHEPLSLMISRVPPFEQLFDDGRGNVVLDSELGCPHKTIWRMISRRKETSNGTSDTRGR